MTGSAHPAPPVAPWDGDLAPPADTRTRRRFHHLRVTRLIDETADAKSVVVDVPRELAALFAYQPGQFLTVRVVVDGEDHLRSYSMSSAPVLGDALRITVKRVPGGTVSNWLLDNLVEGAGLEVTPPAGSFVLGTASQGIVAFAAGSGITPVLSIITTALHTTDQPVRLLYANRDRDSVIFRAELASLAERFGGRLTVRHHVDAEHGLVAPGEVAAFVAGAGPADFYVCGPTGFLDTVEEALTASGVHTDRIHVERFTPEDAAPAPADESPGTATAAASLTITLGTRTVAATHRPGMTLLQSARSAGLRAPASCETGSCGTCMARVVDGHADMRNNEALTDEEVAEGWVLTCQAVPTSAHTTVVYE